MYDRDHVSLKVFPAETTQVLEYGLDVTRLSGWKRPPCGCPGDGTRSRPTSRPMSLGTSDTSPASPCSLMPITSNGMASLCSSTSTGRSWRDTTETMDERHPVTPRNHGRFRCEGVAFEVGRIGRDSWCLVRSLFRFHGCVGDDSPLLRYRCFRQSYGTLRVDVPTGVVRLLADRAADPVRVGLVQ